MKLIPKSSYKQSNDYQEVPLNQQNRRPSIAQISGSSALVMSVFRQRHNYTIQVNFKASFRPRIAPMSRIRDEETEEDQGKPLCDVGERPQGQKGACCGSANHYFYKLTDLLIIITNHRRMSTLAAARADNFYRPKNFDPSKVVPRKSDFPEEKPFVVVQGQRVGGSKVRYETPFHVRCEGCHNMVAKGVRFNSIKTWVGNFHTTQIYEFRMKCPQCIQRFVVRTDPENCEYIYVSGAKRIFQTKDCTDESRIRDEEAQRKIKENPFAKLENDFKDKEAHIGAELHLKKLEEMQERGLEDFQLNKALRKQAREMREDEKAYFQEKRAKNLSIPLLPISVQDQIMAEQMQFKGDKTKHIKKQDKAMSQRQRLKQKMRKMKPQFRNKLRQEIKVMNKPTSSVFIKK